MGSVAASQLRGFEMSDDATLSATDKFTNWLRGTFIWVWLVLVCFGGFVVPHFTPVAPLNEWWVTSTLKQCP